MPKRARQQTWLELAVRNAGIRQGMRAMQWAVTWAVARADYGYDPTVEEVADWWKQSVRTSYREQAAFRAAFPELETPAPIFENERARAALADLTTKSRRIEAGKRSFALPIELITIQLGQQPAD